MTDVVLADGTVVDSASEAWRAECEARHLWRLPTKSARYAYLDRVQAKRGETSRKTLADGVMALWERAKAEQDNRVDIDA